jgi:hypothetical protein
MPCLIVNYWDLGQDNQQIADIIDKASAAMVKAWADYPAFQPDFLATLSECFEAIGTNLGVTFQRDGRDGVWWNLLTLLFLQNRLTAFLQPSTNG